MTTRIEDNFLGDFNAGEFLGSPGGGGSFDGDISIPNVRDGRIGINPPSGDPIRFPDGTNDFLAEAGFPNTDVGEDIGKEEQGLLDAIRSQFPWLIVIGLDQFVIDAIRQGGTIEEVLARVRQTPQYKARFPGLVRADGTRRFATEAAYLQEEQRYRQVLIDFGAFDPNNDSAFDYLAFLDQGITPEGLSRRFTVYRSLERGSTELRDAFYVYGGLEVSVDDLYQAVVSPSFRQSMISTYDETIAKQDLNYETYITRATERGLSRVVETLRNMQTLGLVTGAAVSQMMSIDPNFAREMMGALFQSTGSDTGTMSIDELLATFDYAMIGSAARESGFLLPDRQRIEQFRSAGVDRARALRGYSQAALLGTGLESFAARFNQDKIGQFGLEGAFVLGEANAARDVTRLFQMESALGRTGTGFGQNIEGNRIIQQGRARR